MFFGWFSVWELLQSYKIILEYYKYFGWFFQKNRCVRTQISLRSKWRVKSEEWKIQITFSWPRTMWKYKLKDWRIEGLKNWRTEKLKDWRMKLATLKVKSEKWRVKNTNYGLTAWNFRPLTLYFSFPTMDCTEIKIEELKNCRIERLKGWNFHAVWTSMLQFFHFKILFYFSTVKKTHFKQG